MYYDRNEQALAFTEVFTGTKEIDLENGEEMLYITEIKRSKESEEYDGRGVLILPINELLEKKE